MRRLTDPLGRLAALVSFALGYGGTGFHLGRAGILLFAATVGTTVACIIVWVRSVEADSPTQAVETPNTDQYPLWLQWFLPLVVLAFTLALVCAGFINLGLDAAAILFVPLAALVPMGWVVGHRHLWKWELARRRQAAGLSPPLPSDFQVLFLRSFAADEIASKLHGAVTEEEQLVSALATLGHVVAVGRPGEGLPHLGAQRIYYDADTWRVSIDEAMRRCRLVVLRVGRTSVVLWELEHAVRVVAPEKILLFASGTRDLRQAIRIVNRSLGRRRWIRPIIPSWGIGSIGAMALFRDDWSVDILRLPLGILRPGDWEQRLKIRLTLALRPLFRRYRCEPDISAVSFTRCLFVAIAGYLILCVVMSRIY